MKEEEEGEENKHSNRGQSLHLSYHGVTTG
jgi:hypothetical protein